MRSKRAVVRVLTMGRRSAKCGTLPGVSEGFTASFPSLESLLMKIAVCVKEVPDAAVHKRIDPETKRLDRSGEGTLNHFDTQAVEEALRIKEAQNEGEVVLISMGPEKALDSLRKALAMGADRAVLVSDEGASGSDLVATSRALAAAVQREEADLVLFGQQGSDSDGAVLWAAVAERLRVPVISQVAELEVGDGKLKGKRQTEFGYDVIEAPLPRPPLRGPRRRPHAGRRPPAVPRDPRLPGHLARPRSERRSWRGRR